MKKFKKLLIFLFIIPCTFLFSACSFLESPSSVYVTDIKQTDFSGQLTTYTIYYSNGTTSMFTVENGKDGKDGDDLTLDSIKEYCEENDIDFESFLKEYLTVQQESSVKEAANKAIQSAVSVWCEFPTSTYYENDVDLACGAGIVYKMNEDYSYIITNYHVVYYKNSTTTDKIANKIHIFQYGTQEGAYSSEDAYGNTVITYGEGAVEATYVGGSLNYDIAVLKVATDTLKTYNENVAPVTIAQDYSLAETAIAIGNPEGDGISVTEGVISVESETIEMTGADEKTICSFRVLRMDTAVNGGNSGGGLFNVDGELIGIVNAKVVDSDIDNIAYALPYDNITKVADNLIYYYEQTNTASKIHKFVLDLEYTTENNRAVYNPTTNETILKNDLVVSTVYVAAADNTHIGAAYTAGILSGDIIKGISINGVEHNFTRAYELGDLLLTVRAGDKVLFKVVRENQTITLGFSSSTGVSATYLDIIA